MHPDGQRRPPLGGAPTGNQNARKHGVYSAYVPISLVERAQQRPQRDLQLEIAVVRELLEQLFASELPAVELIGLVDRVTGTLVRLLKANMHFKEQETEQLDTVVERYLTELGLGPL
jgi:hypothetical protein